MDKPFLYPFAKDGDRNTELPNANATDNSVSFQSGFTLPYELNPANGGKNLERKDMNEIFFRICDAINNISQEVDRWVRLTTENLNEVKEKGRYFQNSDPRATTANNYPQNKAGYLIVLNNGIALYSVTQIYKIWNSDKIFIRRTTSATEWSAWDSFVLTSEFNSKITQLQNADTNLNNNKENKARYSMIELRNTNLNSVVARGFYQIMYQGGNTNTPFNEAGFLFVYNYGENTVKQIAIAVNNPENSIHTRYLHNNSWTAWDSFVTNTKANSTYRKISDSYTKTETNTQISNAVNSTTHRYKALRCNPSANTIQWQTGGLSISKPSAGNIRITHNLNTTNYSISATSAKLSGANLSLQYSIVSMTANYVELASSPDNHPSILCVTIFY